MAKFLTWEYPDGRKITQQWCPIIDGVWKYIYNGYP